MKSVVKTVRFSENILEEIRPVMNKTNLNFTGFVIEAIKTYIRILSYSDGVNKSFGAWKNNSHHELKNGTSNYIKKMREGRKI